MYHGRITKARKKRKYLAGGNPAETTVGERREKRVEMRGGKEKMKLIAERYANVFLGDKYAKCEILAVMENPADKDFTRRNIITKGAVLKAKTPQGKEIQIRVTSRPGQDGLINAISL